MLVVTPFLVCTTRVRRRTLASSRLGLKLRSICIRIVRSKGRQNLTLSAVTIPYPGRASPTLFVPTTTPRSFASKSFPVLGLLP